ncbi:MAG TPA: sodium/proline symporter PutP [Gammaproteobacteria bacterium]|nr:sodium/proline symporter PutP [Gammaproteobacteria bacterium]
MYTTPQTLITFAIYIFGMLLLGWLGYKATSNLSDYILGGRRLGKFVTALSAGASDMSGWLLMGLPGLIYLTGISGAWIAIGLIIGAWLNWRFVAGRLRLFTEKCGNSLTLPDYFTSRFEDNTNILRIISALSILIFFTLYCASGIVASTKLFVNMFHMPHMTAMWLGAGATILYVFIGGFLAVSWTDTIQASLMITALIMAPLMLIFANGGLHPTFIQIKTTHPEHLDLFSNLDTIGIMSLLAWGLGYFGQPHILVRFMAAQSPETIPGARRISMTWMILCLVGAISVGLFGHVFFSSHPNVAANVVANPETVFIEAAKQLFNPWVTGFLLAAILAAIMSTLSCQLLVCSSALTKDIYKTFLRKSASQRELIWCGRAMVLLIALLAIWLASNPNNQVLKMVSYAWAGFGAAFGPVILLSLIWPRMTKAGALAGIVIGTASVLIWKHYQWLQVYEIIPGFILATGSIIAVSLFSAPPVATANRLFAKASEKHYISPPLMGEG